MSEYPADILAKYMRGCSEQSGLPLIDTFDQDVEKLRKYFDQPIETEPLNDGTFRHIIRCPSPAGFERFEEGE